MYACTYTSNAHTLTPPSQSWSIHLLSTSDMITTVLTLSDILNRLEDDPRLLWLSSPHNLRIT